VHHLVDETGHVGQFIRDRSRIVRGASSSSHGVEYIE
jgi:hypothetical protein